MLRCYLCSSFPHILHFKNIWNAYILNCFKNRSVKTLCYQYINFIVLYFQLIHFTHVQLCLILRHLLIKKNSLIYSLYVLLPNYTIIGLIVKIVKPDYTFIMNIIYPFYATMLLYRACIRLNRALFLSYRA